MLACKKANYRRIGVFASVLCILFFLYYAYQNFSEIPSINWSPFAILIALISIGLVVLNIGIVGTIWYLLLRSGPCIIKWPLALAIVYTSQFGKYLPGNVGQHIGRILMAHEAKVPVPQAISAVLIETLWGLGIGATMAATFLLLPTQGGIESDNLLSSPLALSGLGLLLLAAPWICVHLANRFAPRLIERFSEGALLVAPKLTIATCVGVLHALCFITMGIVLKLHASVFFGTDAGNVLQLSCIFALVWLAGYLMPGAPGGLGIRETIMILLLSPLIGSGAAIGIGVTLRITTVLGDLVGFVFGLTLRKRLLQRMI